MPPAASPSALPDGVPSLLERPARLLIESGHSPIPALAMSLTAARGVCQSGESLSGIALSEATRAAFCGALGRWQATRNEQRETHKQLHRYRDLKMTPDEQRQLAESFEGSAAVVEGVLSGLSDPTPITFQLIEALGGDPDIDAARDRFSRELADLRVLVEATRRGQPRASGPNPAPRKPMQLKKPGLPRPPLRKGDQGKRVAALQNRLNSLGHDVRSDGVFGSKTHKAVKEFQTHATLKSDGVVGPETTTAMRGAPADSEIEARHGDVPGQAAPGNVQPNAGAASERGGRSSEGAPQTQLPGQRGVAGVPTPDAPTRENAAMLPEPGVLYKGMGVGEESHPGVAGLQQKLGAAGFETQVDGKFGPDTHRQVKRFQSAWGLRRDGMVGQKTQSALDDAAGSQKKLKEAVEQRIAAQQRGDVRAFTQWRARELALQEAVTNRQMCPSCGRGMSAHLSKCPRCGRDLPEDGKLMVAGRGTVSRPKEPTPPPKSVSADLAEDAVVPPPHLRAATDAGKRCGVCKMYDAGLCWGYGDHPVESGWVCDSFAKGSQLAEGLWDALRHPRGRGGEFRQQLLSSNATVRLADGTKIEKHGEQIFHVGSGPGVEHIASGKGEWASGTTDLPGVSRTGNRYLRVEGVDNLLGLLNHVNAPLPGAKPPQSPGTDARTAGRKPGDDWGAYADPRGGEFMKCPKCGTVQAATHKSCSKCGHSLAAARKAKFANSDVEEAGMLAEAKASVGEKSLIDRHVAQLTETDLEEALVDGGREFAQLAFDLGTSAPRLLMEAKDSMLKASTPEPFSTSKTSNWVARVGGLPDYIQHIAHALVNKRGKSVSNAIQMAIGIAKRWAKGVGKVDKNTRAAAAKAVGEWMAKRAASHAKSATKKAAAAT